MKPAMELITNDFVFINMQLVRYEDDNSYFRDFWLRLGGIILSVKIP